MEYKTVDFPPINAEMEAKMKKLFATMGELMDETIETESVITLRAKVPSDRIDVLTILKRIAKAHKTQAGNSKAKAVSAKPAG